MGHKEFYTPLKRDRWNLSDFISYQVLYKNSLEDANWVNLGTSVTGDGTVKSVNDPIAGARRFYRLSIQ